MAKIDELHNYAKPDNILDELHRYDKSIAGNTSGWDDEIHFYGNRGVTYGLDEMHLYGSYQTVEEDEVNKPTEREVIDIDEYFDEIEDLDEDAKEERKDLAKEFKDILMLILMLILADLRVGNEINRGFYESLAKSRMMDAVDRILISITTTIYQKINLFIDHNIDEVIDSTLRNQKDPYFFSEARATSIAVDDSMASVNIEELQEAIDAGYKYKIWVTMRDRRVRHSHELVDGKRVEIDKPFKVGRCLMQAPLIFDEKSEYQDVKEFANCRCVLAYSNKAD